MATGNGLFGLLQASELKEQANKIEGVYGQFEETMGQVRGLIHGLDGMWKGLSEEALVQRFDSEQPSINELGQTIRDYAREARRAADKAQTMNSDLSNLVRKLLFPFFQ